MSTTFQIITKGQVYVFNRRLSEFEVTLRKARRLLQAAASKESTFDYLHKGIAEEWLLREDVVKPFGDRRQNLTTVCSFDLDQDLLLYSDASGNIQLPLDRLRGSDSDLVQRSDFTPFDIPGPSKLDLTKFSPPYQKPTAPIPERRVAFTSRILSDFVYQWRHVLRSSYNEATLRRLAKAVISIATSDFQVEEVFERLQIYLKTNVVVSVFDIPAWEPYDSQMFNIGRTTVVLNQELHTALELAKGEAKRRTEVVNLSESTQYQTYLLLSVRHMLVCHIDSTGTFSYTAPTVLMDGLTPPSPSAIYLLLQALLPSRPPPRTPINNLPLEIQDRILESVSIGPVEAARLGCVLGIGSPFLWMRRVDPPRRGGPVELFVSYSHRHAATPVESKIYFGNSFSGVSER